MPQLLPLISNRFIAGSSLVMVKLPLSNLIVRFRRILTSSWRQLPLAKASFKVSTLIVIRFVFVICSGLSKSKCGKPRKQKETLSIQ